MYVYEALGEDYTATAANECWSSLHAWAVGQVYDGLSGFQKLLVSKTTVGNKLGAPGSADFQRLTAAAQQSVDALVAEMQSRASLDDAAVGKIKAMYPDLRARVDACATMAQAKPAAATGATASTETWWDDETKQYKTKTTTETASRSTSTETSEPEVAQAGFGVLPLLLVGGALWFLFRR
jgi:hypothetical protein